jgi:probable phosphoglycerate mutase
MSMLAYFIRHGQTDWNAEFRFQGQAEVDINARGREQARANGRLLAGLIADASAFDFVASPMRRTRETMEIIRAEMGLPAEGYRTDGRLVEVHFGDWQGHTAVEIEAVLPGSVGAREGNKWGFLPPGAGAESYERLSERVRPWLDELSRPTVCVTHGGVMRAVLLMMGALSRSEAEAMEVPQDRVLRLEGGRLDWL